MTRLLALLLLCAAGPLAPAADAAVITIRRDLNANPDGSRTSQYPCTASDRSNCKDPAIATLAWDNACLPSLTGLDTGTPYSSDVRACLDGTAAATATITVQHVSGDNAATEGWAIDGDDLEHPGDNAGAGAFRLRATDSGDSVDSDSLNWSFAAAPSSDSLAPPTVTGLEVTGTDVNEVSLRWDFSCDNHDGSEAGSGTKQYNIRRDSTVIDTVSTATCVRNALTETIVGSSDGTPSSTQDGNGWDLSFGGAGVGGTTDNVLMRTTELSGDVTVIGKATALTTAAEFGKVGAVLLADDASGAVGCFIHYQSNARIQMRCRGAQGAATANVFSQTVALPACFKAVWSTAGSVTGYYSDDCGAWIEGGSYAAPHPGTVTVGGYITSNSAGTNATGELEFLNIHSQSQVTRDVSTASAGSFSVSVDDNEDNESAYPVGVVATPGSPPASGGIKWDPGHYMLAQLGDSQSTLVNTRAAEVCANDDLRGMQARYYWASLESTQGNYTLSNLTALYNALAACGKRLVLQIMDRKFNTSSPNNIIPTYVQNMGGTNQGIAANVTGYVAKIYLQGVMDRKIALVAAICTALPNLYGITVAESVMGFGDSPPSDYTAAALVAQIQRAMESDREHCPTNNIVFYANFLNGGTTAQFQSLYDSAQEFDVLVGGPDVIPDDTTTGDEILVGTLGTTDYRGDLGIAYAVQTPELGGKEGDFTPEELHEHARDVLNASHIFWVRKTTTPGSTWTDIVNYLAPGTRDLIDTCPSTMTCDTD